MPKIGNSKKTDKIEKKAEKESVKHEEPAQVQAPAAPAPVALTKPQETLLAKKMAAQARMIKESGVSGGLAADFKPPEFYPTGLPVFDGEVIGIGGIPKGRIVEFYGIKSSGKSATAMFLAGAVQRLDPTITVKIYDHEHSFTKQWGISLGLDVNRTTVVEKMSAETMASQIHEDLSLGELAPNIIIIDSIAVLTPEEVMETEIEDRSMHDNYARSKFLTEFLDSLDGFYWPPAGKEGDRKSVV
jgi:RecA/RadA recombinase